MFSKLIELVKEALKKMVGYKDVAETVEDDVDINISSAMREAVNNWKQIYKDESPWLDEENGVYSLSLGKAICQSLQLQVLSEMESKVEPKASGSKERAEYLDKQYQEHLIAKLPQEIEVGMALGSLIMKPYIVNGNIYIDFCRQGTFVPLAYDDDGNIIDVIFPDKYISGKYVYTKLERQTFSPAENKLVIENKVYKAQKKDDEEDLQLGNEVELKEVKRWENIAPETTVENVERPLFGYYKVPLANNIDLESPLGISVFSPAVKMMQRADEQFSSLDWEYRGGEMAVDVDFTALNKTTTYFGGQEKAKTRLDKHNERLYRQIDLGDEKTYEVFAPSLRDTAYIAGLNKYLTKIEDLIGLARGSISEVEAEGRTATEIRILKQRAYITIASHQTAIQKALEDLVYAMDVFATLYELAADGGYELTVNWKDSVLTDTQEELNQKMELLNAEVLADWEVRMWYTGEDEETAKKAIEEIKEGSESSLEQDIFSNTNLLQNEPFNANAEGQNVPAGEEAGENNPVNEEE